MTVISAGGHSKVSLTHQSTTRRSIQLSCCLLQLFAAIVVTSHLLVTSLYHTHVSAPYSCSRLSSWRHTSSWRHSIDARVCSLQLFAVVVVTSYLLVTPLYHTHVSAPYSCSWLSSWRHTSSPRRTAYAARASRSASGASRRVWRSRFTPLTATQITACSVLRSDTSASRCASARGIRGRRTARRRSKTVRGSG